MMKDATETVLVYNGLLLSLNCYSSKINSVQPVVM